MPKVVSKRVETMKDEVSLKNLEQRHQNSLLHSYLKSDVLLLWKKPTTF